MTDKIHPDAPTDDEGHPIHPETAARICGRSKSDRTTPSDHGRERDDIPYCTLTAGWGTDGGVGACKHHGGNAPSGPENGNYKTGAFSEHFQSDLTDRERDAYTDLAGALEDAPSDVVRDVVAEAMLKYKRSGDARFLREARQWASEFGLIEAAPDKLEVEGDLSLDETQKEMLDEMFDRDPQPK